MTEQPEGPVFYDRCRACGSDKLLGQGLADEMIERGIVPATFRFSLQNYEGLPLDEAAMQRLPFGASVPGIKAVADACGECGTLRVIRYERLSMSKKPMPEKLTRPLLVPPNPGDLRNN